LVVHDGTDSRPSRLRGPVCGYARHRGRGVRWPARRWWRVGPAWVRRDRGRRLGRRPTPSPCTGTGSALAAEARVRRPPHAGSTSAW